MPVHPAGSVLAEVRGRWIFWEGDSMRKRGKSTGLGGRDTWGPGDSGQVILLLRTSVYPQSIHLYNGCDNAPLQR